MRVSPVNPYTRQVSSSETETRTCMPYFLCAGICVIAIFNKRNNMCKAHFGITIRLYHVKILLYVNRVNFTNEIHGHHCRLVNTFSCCFFRQETWLQILCIHPSPTRFKTSSGDILLGVTLQWTTTTHKYRWTEQAQAPLFPYSKLGKRNININRFRLENPKFYTVNIATRERGCCCCSIPSREEYVAILLVSFIPQKPG